MLPCGIVKKLIRLICRDCSSGGGEGPGAICGSVVCLVGCDEWVERMLICAWKASQLPTCWGSKPASRQRETPTPGWYHWWSGGGDVMKTTQLSTSWPLLDLASLLVNAAENETVKEPKDAFHKTADVTRLPHQWDQDKNHLCLSHPLLLVPLYWWPFGCPPKVPGISCPRKEQKGSFSPLLPVLPMKS